MKELTEQQAKELRIVANQIYEELGSGYGYNGPKYRAVAIIEIEILSLLSKDQPAKPTVRDIFPIAGPGVRPKTTLTAEEMKSLIEEAKNEDSSPEITSAFELVVVAKEYLNGLGIYGLDTKKRFKEVCEWMEGFASAVASKLARRKIGEYKNPYDQKKQYVEWAAIENALDDLLRNELKNKLK